MITLLFALVRFSFGYPIEYQQYDAVSSSSSSSSSLLSLSSASPSPSVTAVLEPDLPTPMPQPWCTSSIYCPGPLLQAVQLAGLYPDSKTFVDKPTKNPADQVINAFNAMQSNLSTENLVQFVEDNFLGENEGLSQADIPDFNPSPSFLSGVSDAVIRGWLQIVNGYWNKLARKNTQNYLCDGCESSLIPLNNSFIVPGGRFRENYYWDTYFVMEGLLASEIKSMTRSMIENFLDELDTIGFIPNGARTYYLDRSQPPLFARMVWKYLQATNDTAMLDRAVPLIEKEMEWWYNNRTFVFTSPYSSKTYNVSHYAVVNSAPRPEGYVPDFQTAYGDNLTNPDLGLSPQKIQDLYADLASGAESGQDYTSVRWARVPLINVTNNDPSLRTLNLRAQIPVDLNSILYEAFTILSRMYTYPGYSNASQEKSQYWNNEAVKRKEAILDLFWDSERVSFYDFNTTSGARALPWSAAAYYPYFNGIFPDEVLSSEDTAQKAFSSLGFITARYNGSIPTTIIDTGLQWDFPNVWPPHIAIIIQAVKAIPDNISSAAFEDYSSKVANFSSLPPNQLIANESDLPPQPILGDNRHNITSSPGIGYLGNVGNVTGNATIGWRDGLLYALANRYISSAFCSWYDTGGSIPGILDRLPDGMLSGSKSSNGTGQMFEKFDVQNIDAAGAGGEYEVQDGFGWTNGLALWLGQHLGNVLVRPECPPAVDSGGNVLVREASYSRKTGCC